MSSLGFTRPRVGVVLAAAVVLSGLAGCEVKDPDHIQSREQFEAITTRKPPPPPIPEAPPPIPALQPVIAAPPSPGYTQRLVTISVTDPNVPVRDVLVELARKVGADLDLDPAVSGGVIVTAHNRPFQEVLARICDMANLRYSLKDNVVKVEPDTPFYHLYHLDMLNMSRDLTTDFGTSLSISSLIQGSGSSGGGSNQSSTEIKGTSKQDPWKELEDNIRAIMSNSAPVKADHPTPATPAPVVAPVAAAPAAPAAAVAPGSATPAAGSAEGVVAAATAATTGTPAAAAAPAAQAAPATAAAASGGGDPVNPYSLNKQAGILSVYGTGKQQALVKAYLEKVIRKIGTQVLIEAKVVEISLNSQYNTGVDWQSLRANLNGTSFGVSNLTPAVSSASAIPILPTPGALTNPFGTFGLNAGFTTFGGDLAAMINLVKSYGDVRTLSSPRLTVMNNEAATLKVAENHVYFKLQATVTSTPASAGSVASQTATYNSTLQTLPIGLVMTVQPAIDIEHGLVTLGLRPSVTAWPGNTVSDPAVALGIASACGSAITGACSATNIANAVAAAAVPIVDVREMESVVTVPSGAVVVLGGLMQQISSKTDSGIPGAADVPVVGNLFKANSDSMQLTELVVFLKASLVEGPDTVDWADKDSYRYVHDPRPLNF